MLLGDERGDAVEAVAQTRSDISPKVLWLVRRLQLSLQSIVGGSSNGQLLEPWAPKQSAELEVAKGILDKKYPDQGQGQDQEAEGLQILPKRGKRRFLLLVQALLLWLLPSTCPIDLIRMKKAGLEEVEVEPGALQDGDATILLRTWMTSQTENLLAISPIPSLS